MIRYALLFSTAICSAALVADAARAEGAPAAAKAPASSGRSFLDPRVNGVFSVNPGDDGAPSTKPAPQADPSARSPVSSGRAFLDPRIDGVFYANAAEGGPQPGGGSPPSGGPRRPGLSGSAFLDPRVDGVFLVDPGSVEAQPPQIANRAMPTNAKDFWSVVSQSVRGRTSYPDELKADPTKEAPSGRVLLSFAIDKDGRLQDEKISQSSGNAKLDAAALDALRQATPFPPPPADVGSAKATLPIVFHAPAPEPKDPPNKPDSKKAP